ncbi:hypothetical protein QJS10_CPB19g00481 [Acorus calamus]|uniref:Cupin type-1 domain-containing protein n=1 Tax=Acorus calamus TaxID=4465 RepID=A0AAV9CIM6_ACOCL|nr:hypothetical protein QJS10_CPB19g00481 [Acorus calamus]
MNDGQSNINPVGPLFTKEERRTLAFTESGRISAVDIDVGRRGPYHLEFITLEPNSLLLPLHLHTDMVFYVQSVPYPKKNETEEEVGGEGNPNWKKNILEALIGGRRGALAADEDPNKSKKKKTKTFNLFSRKPDFENCNGWSLAVIGKDLHALKGDSELPKCRNMRFKVKEGDVFVVPRFFPMAQMSFNDDSLVFMGFNTMARKNRPQFLAGRRGQGEGGEEGEREGEEEWEEGREEVVVVEEESCGRYE